MDVQYIDYPVRRELALELPELKDFFWGEFISGMVVSPDGSMLAISGVSDYVYLRDLPSRSLLHTFVPWVGRHLEHIFGMEFHPALPYFAFIERHGSVSLVNRDSWVPLAALDYPDDPAIAIAFAHEKNLLAIGQQSGRVTVWSIDERRELLRDEFGEFIFSLSFSLDDGLLGIAPEDRAASFICLAAGEGRTTAPPQVGVFQCGAFSPNGSFFVGASSRGALRLWSVPEFKLVNEVTAPTEGIVACTSSRGSPLFAVRDTAGMVFVWDYLGDSAIQMIAPADNVARICFSASGKELLMFDRRCVWQVDLTS